MSFQIELQSALVLSLSVSLSLFSVPRDPEEWEDNEHGRIRVNSL